MLEVNKIEHILGDETCQDTLDAVLGGKACRTENDNMILTTVQLQGSKNRMIGCFKCSLAGGMVRKDPRISKKMVVGWFWKDYAGIAKKDSAGGQDMKTKGSTMGESSFV